MLANLGLGKSQRVIYRPFSRFFALDRICQVFHSQYEITY